MKSLYTLSFLILSISLCFGQNYNTNQTTGTSFPYMFNDASAVTLLENDVTDALSTLQTIPFTFTFYGNAVTQYYASDNGYITFDTGATTSDPSNVALPDAGGPNNAIYAFWYDMELTTTGTDDEVRSFTYGTAPKRTHVIQWYSVQPTGTSQFLYAAIRLHECGDFDIIHNYSNASGLTGTVGCEDATGSNGTQITGSPTLDISSLGSDPADDEVYSFYWDQVQYDLSISSSDLVDFALIGSNNISGELVNNGSLDITSYDLNYTIDGGATQTMSVSSTITANGGTASFSHSTPWTVSTGGVNHTLCIWADNLNGMSDERTCNDQLCEDLFSHQGISGTRSILVEEFTGSWCGYCPDGALKLESLIADNPGIVHGVSIHNGDAMAFSDGIQSSSGFNATSFPSGMINRTLVSGQIKEPFSRSLWEAEVNNQVSSYTPVDVSVASTYNITNRELSITITGDFTDFAGGDLRFVPMLIEDSVTGTGSGYDQVNYYSSAHSSGGVGGASHPHYNDPTPIVGYVHNHVLRAVPAGAFGNSGVISSPVSPGASLSESFTMTVPATVNENHIKVVGFISYYSTEIGERSILDVDEVVPTAFVGVEELSLESALMVFPNPATDNVELVLVDQLYQAETMSLIDMTGKTLRNKRMTNNRLSLDVSAISSGIYILTVRTTDGHLISKRIMVK